MGRAMRMVLVAVLTITGALMSTGLARADVNNSTGTNVQSGSNRSTGSQSGSSKTGDAVGGQVTGVVSSGRTSVDATNHSTNSDVTSGDASGSNTASTFTGLNTSDASTVGAGAQDISGVLADNLQDGSNRTTFNQSSSAVTGDGVAGQVIGAVTAAGGSASIVAANTSNDVSVQTGDANDPNSLSAFTGLDLSDTTTVLATDISDSCNTGIGCFNVQDGNNRTNISQRDSATTGDGVAGQVIGAVSAGATSIDARNTSDGVDVTTGDATTDNSAAAFTGLNTSGTTTVEAQDITDSCNGNLLGISCNNVQDGNNDARINQTATAATGDGVAGEVIGAVTSAGGSASIVAANTSRDSDVTTGDASSDNSLAAFTGLNDAATTTVFGGADVTGSCTTIAGCDNVQNGNNRLTGSQTANSSTGDGVAGQVLGVVSAGAASLDATNTTVDSSVTTGDSDATNSGSEFVGLNFAPTTTVGGSAEDIASATAVNLQDGSNHKTLSQTANATSGDGVAGQVSGVVTSAGGSASVVLANTSTSIDSTSGDTTFDNSDNGFVGQNTGEGPLTVL